MAGDYLVTRSWRIAVHFPKRDVAGLPKSCSIYKEVMLMENNKKAALEAAE